MKKIILTLLCICCCGFLAAQSYRIGDLYTAPDGSQGIVYYIHPDGSGGWVVALNDASTGCAWGNASDVPALADQAPTYLQQLLNDTAGYANTSAIRAHQNNNTAYAAGMVDFEHGWVLPSPAQLSMLYGQLPFISTALTQAGGTALTYEGYWCSAERGATNAWFVTFNSGYFNYSAKTSLLRVRAVRSFTTVSVEYDTTLTYLWSTGSTQPHIEVTPEQTTTYTVTATTEFGCSSTAEQTILVGNNMPQNLYDTVCQGAGYEANGFSLTAEETATAGTVERTRTMETSGCSSTLTLFLTVNPAVAELVEATACDSYTWNGITYTESGDYTLTYNSSQGCDSVVTLRLTVNPSPEVTVAATADTICLGDSVTLRADTPSSSLYFVPPVAVGDILCTDNSIEKPSAWPVEGKTAMGIVYFVDLSGEHGWAINLTEQGIRWGGYGTDIPALPSYSQLADAYQDRNGRANTQLIREAGDASTYPAAWAVDLENGWYIPSIVQLRPMYSEILTLNATLALLDYPQISLLEDWWYWSSTEYDMYHAWVVLWRGTVDIAVKYGYVAGNGNGRLRSIRDF